MTHQITTADELFQASGLGRCELVRGELFMMSPAGFEHGQIAGLLCLRLGQYVENRALGTVTGAETGFLISRSPDTVRAPDVAFIRAERLPSAPIRGFFPGAPDLAVEVLSPNDVPREVAAKTREWLDAGCRAVWVIDPLARTVTVHQVGARGKSVLRVSSRCPMRCWRRRGRLAQPPIQHR